MRVFYDLSDVFQVVARARLASFLGRFFFLFFFDLKGCRDRSALTAGDFVFLILSVGFER